MVYLLLTCLVMIGLSLAYWLWQGLAQLSRVLEAEKKPTTDTLTRLHRIDCSEFVTMPEHTDITELKKPQQN